MDIVLGILILLALCGSGAAKNGLTLMIGVPLGLLAAIMIIGMVGAGITAVTAPRPTPAAIREAPVEQDDARNAQGRIIELRQRHGAQALSWTP